jgi:hypothetical protein
MIGYLTPDNPDAWKRPAARRMIGKIMQAGHPVVLTCGPMTANIIFVMGDWTPKKVMDEVCISHNKCKEVVT